MLQNNICSVQSSKPVAFASPSGNSVRLRVKSLRPTWPNKTNFGQASSSGSQMLSVQCRASSNSPKANPGSEEPYLPSGWLNEWWQLFLKTQGPYWFGGAWAIILFTLYRAVKQSQLDKLAQLENLDQFL